MTAQEYIESKLEDLKSTVKVEASLKMEADMTDFIFKSVMSKKFRKLSISPEQNMHIKEAIALNVKNNEPIKFAFSFGGYKLWRFEESPEPDWAELFAIMYYIKWMKPILAVYKPGVWFDFVTDGVILDQMNNVPKEDPIAYRKCFKQLISFLEPYTPSNLKITLTEVGDFYDTQKEFEADLADKIEQLKSSLPDGLPELTQKDIETIELNVKLKDGQADDPLWREKVKLLHDAYMLVSKKRPYYKKPDKIMVLATKFKGMLVLGTTKSSTAKFWVGLGSLKKEGDKYKDCVLTPSQVRGRDFIKERVSIGGLNGLKNFKEIRVFE